MRSKLEIKYYAKVKEFNEIYDALIRIREVENVFQEKHDKLIMEINKISTKLLNIPKYNNRI